MLSGLDVVFKIHQRQATRSNHYGSGAVDCGVGVFLGWDPKSSCYWTEIVGNRNAHILLIGKAMADLSTVSFPFWGVEKIFDLAV